jgi:hypothetical protein
VCLCGSGPTWQTLNGATPSSSRDDHLRACRGAASSGFRCSSLPCFPDYKYRAPHDLAHSCSLDFCYYHTSTTLASSQTTRSQLVVAAAAWATRLYRRWDPNSRSRRSARTQGVWARTLWAWKSSRVRAIARRGESSAVNPPLAVDRLPRTVSCAGMSFTPFVALVALSRST